MGRRPFWGMRLKLVDSGNAGISGAHEEDAAPSLPATKIALMTPRLIVVVLLVGLLFLPGYMPSVGAPFSHPYYLKAAEESTSWYLAEGCTAYGMQTYILVQNPNAEMVYLDLTFMTNSGPKGGPQNFPLPGNSRTTFLVNNYVPNCTDVSTRVQSDLPVICERAMYGPDMAWAHESLGFMYNAAPTDKWWKTFGGSGNEEGRSILTETGLYVVAGYTESLGYIAPDFLGHGLRLTLCPRRWENAGCWKRERGI